MTPIETAARLLRENGWTLIAPPDPDSLLDQPVALVALIDQAAQGRKLYGDEGYAEIATMFTPGPAPTHDWRWHVSHRDGALTIGHEAMGDGCCTFGRHTTATEVAEYLRTKGLIS